MRLIRSALFGTILMSGLARCPLRAAETLTLYAAQHHQLVDMVTAAFTKQTGIDVRARFGEAPELASQLIREGHASPADLYFTENSPELVLLDEKGLLAPVDKATLALAPTKDSAPDGNWLGLLLRENVLVFNPAAITETAMPASLLDLAKPEWKGRVAVAPSDADFLPLVQAVVTLKGRDAALAWLKGLKANAQVFDDDEGVVAAVEHGGVATGVINSYYWARARTEAGADKTKSQIHHFGGQDVGALLNISGAGILKSSKHKAAAEKFLAFLVSKPVQQMVAASDIDFEYPVAVGVPANPLLKPMAELEPPSLTVSQLGDDQNAAGLLREAGLI